MWRLFGVIALLTAAMSPANPADAEIAWSYVKPGSERSAGEWLADILGLSGFGRSYAVVIGLSRFEYFNPLDATENDPQRVFDFFRDEAGFDYILMLRDKEVTYQALRELFEFELPRTLQSNDRFLLFWSGHGTQFKDARGVERGYLPLVSSPKDNKATMVNMADLERWDNDLPAKQALFLLDACFSGLAGMAAQSEDKDLEIRDLSKPGHHIISAGRSDEQTIASLQEWQGSIFTHALLHALSGKADRYGGKNGGDGVINLYELVADMGETVKQAKAAAGWNRPLRPVLNVFAGRGDGQFFFLTNERKRSYLEAQGKQVGEEMAYGMPVVVMGTAEGSPAATSGPYGGRDATGLEVIKDSPIVINFDDKMSVFEAGLFERGTNKHELTAVEQEISKYGSVFDNSFYSNAQPSSLVHIQAFSLDKHEVTWAEYERFTDTSDSFDEMPAWVQRYKRGDDYPVVGVTWQEADAFCRHRGKRLPSEAEWERAARGDKGRSFPWGNSLPLSNDVVFCSTCPAGVPKEPYPSPPGSSEQDTTPEGVRDLAGNVREWVSDWYASSFYALSYKNPENTTESEYRSVRGGSWYHGAAFLVAFARSGNEPSRRDPTIGFRCAASRPTAVAGKEEGR